MSELTNKKRNSLKNSTFGIPSLRKYPLNDKEHVLKAIQMFHYCPLENKKELAHNINNAAKKYDITISQSSNIYDYLNESEQIEIDLFEDIYLLEQDLYLNEAFGMNETEAKGIVDTAISLWKKRKSFVRTDSDKSKLLSDIRAENASVRSMQNQGDFNGILVRARENAKKMSKKISSGEYDKAKHARGKGEQLTTAGKTVGKSALIAGGALAAGAVIGGALGKRSANNKGNGSVMTKVKVGAGAAAGIAAGAAIGTTAVAGSLASDAIKKDRAKDPDKPLRQHAERYINFIGSFQSEILEFRPGQNQQKEGED